MIVNTAYMYMGKTTPKTLNIWEGGVVNYPYRIFSSTSQSKFIANENKFYVYRDDTVRFTLPLTNFTKITFEVYSGAGTAYGSVTIGNKKSDFRTPGAPTVGTFVFDIPAEYQKDNVLVDIRCTAGGSGMYVVSGVIS